MDVALLAVLRERGPEFSGKVKAANFVRNHPNLSAAALGAGIATALLARHNRRRRKRDDLVNNAYRGAMIAGGASLASELLSKKASALGSVVDSTKALYKARRPEILGGLAGAGVSAAVGAATGIRGKKGTSYMERQAKERRAELAGKRAELKAQGKKPGFAHKMHDVSTKAYQGLAKAVAEHPAAGAALFGITGATLGAGLGREFADTLNRWRQV